MKCSLEMLNSFKIQLSKFHYSKKEKYFLHFMDSTMLTLRFFTKWAKINLQTSFRPIWNPENQGYKIGYMKSDFVQEKNLKNDLEKSVRILFSNSINSDLGQIPSTI